jgi:hypothetical protein
MNSKITDWRHPVQQVPSDDDWQKLISAAKESDDVRVNVMESRLAKGGEKRVGIRLFVFLYYLLFL